MSKCVQANFFQKIKRNLTRRSPTKKRTKIKVNRSNVLLFGAKSWRITEADMSRPRRFDNKCLPRILNLFRPNVISVYQQRNHEVEMNWPRVTNGLRNPHIALTWQSGEEDDLVKRGKNCNKRKDQAALELMDCGRAQNKGQIETRCCVPVLRGTEVAVS